MKNVNLSDIRNNLMPYLLATELPKGMACRCPLVVRQNWNLNSNNVDEEDNSDFVDSIFKYLISKSLHSSDNIRIIVGGIGTGKSTTLKMVQEKIQDFFNEPKNQHKLYISFVFDFMEFEDVDDSIPVTEEMKKNFYNLISAKILSEINISFDRDENEIVRFLDWCLKNYSLLSKSGILQRLLEPERASIQLFLEAKETPQILKLRLKSIINTYKEIIHQLEPEDMTWYIIFKVIYEFEQYQKKRMPVYLFLDNVDHLHPEIQRKAVIFANALTHILKSKTLITIRPLTWERGMHATELIDVIYQHSPEITAVIRGRIEWYLSENVNVTSEDKRILKSLIEMFSGDHPYYKPLKNLLQATSGIGIRFGLRNFCNMLESPKFAKIVVNGDEDPFIEFKIWELSRAFLYSSDISLVDHTFDNLYMVGKNHSIPLLKPRILHYLIFRTNTFVELSTLIDYLQKFGYNEVNIEEALNELLRRTRPLAWCSTGFTISFTTLNINPAGRLMITPMGKSYFQNLFGAYEYDESCIAKGPDDFAGVINVFKFHQKLHEIDLREIKTYYDRMSPHHYVQIMNGEIDSLALMHWRNLGPALERVSKSFEGAYHHDPLREEFLIEQIKEILNL